MSNAKALWPALLPPEAQGDDGVCLESARGHRLVFADGSSRLCATSGLWNVNLGYGNEAIATACATALRDASYLGTFRYENAHARRAAEGLVKAAGPDHYARVLFSTSGGAANDLVMKLARWYQVVRGAMRQRVVVGLRHSYHGMTYGSFGLTGEALGQELYGVDRRFVRHVAPNQVGEFEALMALEGAQVAAVVVEPVLGSGTVPLEPAFVAALGRARDQYGFLLVADEVATGFGRTGEFFATQTWSVRPDVLVLSKALTNGTLAAAAVVVAREVAEVLSEPGLVLAHGETQAGTAVTAAAVTATLAEFARLDAVVAGRRVAFDLEAELVGLRDEVSVDLALTGVGLFRTLRVFDCRGTPLDAARVRALVAAVRTAGAVVHPGVGGVQLVPALTYARSDVDELLDCLRRGLSAFLRTESAA